MERLIYKIMETIKENNIIGNNSYRVGNLQFTKHEKSIYIEILLDKEEKGE